MSLLAPLYIAGLAALALPILFHLIRRAPQGRQEFSSLMFLSPSPPRLTRRSRLTNIVLLLLRAAALALLVLAFARPFFQRNAQAGVGAADGRRVAILVDTSASMRRADLWDQAKRHAEKALRDIGPADEVGLFFFDRSVRLALTFAEWNELEPSRRAAVLRARLDAAGPTWADTQAGEALATVADLLAEAEGSRTAGGTGGRQLVLISDLQEGGHMEALQGHEWPQNVLLEVKPVVIKESTNASVQLVKGTSEGDGDAGAGVAGGDPDRLRVRVSNQPGAAREQFSLSWGTAQGPLAGVEPVKVYAPAGRSHVARMPRLAPNRQADRLLLSGDDADFDNTLYVVPARVDNVRVLFLGDEAAEDVKGLRYYFERAVGETPQRRVELLARRAADALDEPDLAGTRLAVVAGSVTDERAAVLRQFVDRGGDVLLVLKDASEAATRSLAALGADAVEIEEPPVKDFALIGRIDADHPLFAPFAEARLGDFTKIHFWKHRRVKLPDAAGARVLAAFDNGDSFIFEKPIGRGRLVVATSGWHPADSQLALSTKFVPLIDGFVRRQAGAAIGSEYAVGQPIALPQAGRGDPTRVVVTPDGRRIEIPTAAETFDATDAPGIYRLTLGDKEVPVAVNVAPDESRTAPVSVEDIERWGARVGNRPAPEEIVTRERQLQRIELENRQKMWRWLIVSVLLLLAAETALAGGLAHRAMRQQVTT